MRTRGLLGALAAGTCALALAGCGPILAAALLTAQGSSSGAGVASGTSRASISAVTQEVGTDEAMSVVPAVQYFVATPLATKASVKVDFSSDGGASFRPARPAAGSEGTTDLDVATQHVFRWDYAADLGRTKRAVLVRVSPDVGAIGSGSVVSDQTSFTVDNTSPPNITSLVATPPAQGRQVEVTFTLRDAEANDASVDFAFSVNDGTFQVLPPSTPDLSRSLAALGTSPTGATYSLTWTASTLPAGLVPVKLQLLPRDSRSGQRVTSGSFVVNVPNNQTPVVGFGSLGRPGLPQASIPLTVSDVEGGPVRLDGFELVSVANPNSSIPMTVLTVPGIANLGTSVAYVWNSAANLPNSSARPGLAIRASFTDLVTNVAGTALSPGSFTFGNDAPVVTTPAPLGTPSANVTLAFQVSDTTSDTADLTVQWRFASAPDVPASYAPATIVAGATTGLTTSPGGTSYAVSWASDVDVGIVSTTVVIQVRASDAFAGGVGAFAKSVPFFVANDVQSVQILSVGTPGVAPVDGLVPSRFALFGLSSALDVRVE